MGQIIDNQSDNAGTIFVNIGVLEHGQDPL